MTQTDEAERRRDSHSCGGCCTRFVNLGVTIGSSTVLEGVSLHIHCGELTAIIGPNGAGKTTLFRAILGELPHSGEVHFHRREGSVEPGKARIGYVPQKLDLDRSAPITTLDLFAGATSKRAIWFGCRRGMRDDAVRALSAFEAEHLLTRKIGQLSGGELQRVLLALALVPLPDLLLLDEPIAGIDQSGTDAFYRIVSQLRHRYDLSILLVSHDLAAVARVSDRMIFLNRTVVCDGTPPEVLAAGPVIRTFGRHMLPEAGASPAGASRRHRCHGNGEPPK